jgi:hypothetical protein
MLQRDNILIKTKFHQFNETSSFFFSTNTNILIGIQYLVIYHINVTNFY